MSRSLPIIRKKNKITLGRQKAPPQVGVFSCSHPQPLTDQIHIGPSQAGEEETQDIKQVNLLKQDSDVIDKPATLVKVIPGVTDKAELDHDLTSQGRCGQFDLAL